VNLQWLNMLQRRLNLWPLMAGFSGDGINGFVKFFEDMSPLEKGYFRMAR
jgi:hypothetical protein